MSFIDPRRARVELGFAHEPFESYLGKIVAAFLAQGPVEPPDGLRHREAELRLAARLGA